MADRSAASELPVMGERHHRSWVGPPEYFDRVGALQFVVLVLLGMREHHRLLDIGCGSLRGGRLSILYLGEGNYYGIEPERWALDAGVAHELSPGLAALKKPVFGEHTDIAANDFGVAFDYVMANGIFMHAARHQIKQCFESVASVLAPDGVFVGAYLKGDADSDCDDWTYPEIQRYTEGGLAELAASAGLRVQFVDWPHPFDHRWFVAVHRHCPRVVSRDLDLGVFSWPQYLSDQIAESGGEPRSHVEYLKEDLKARVSPDRAPRVVPQAFT